MHPLTEDEIRGAFVNATEQDLRVMALPLGFMLTEWDYLDFFAWRDPHARGRGYLVTERDGKPTAVVLRAAIWLVVSAANCRVEMTLPHCVYHL